MQQAKECQDKILFALDSMPHESNKQPDVQFFLQLRNTRKISSPIS
jgi:hypothetical protein